MGHVTHICVCWPTVTIWPDEAPSIVLAVGITADTWSQSNCQLYLGNHTPPWKLRNLSIYIYIYIYICFLPVETPPNEYIVQCSTVQCSSLPCITLEYMQYMHTLHYIYILYSVWCNMAHVLSRRWFNSCRPPTRFDSLQTSIEVWKKATARGFF